MQRPRLDAQILCVVFDLERKRLRRVFPWNVQAWLDIDRCEQTLRRDMSRMAQEGKLIRIGGAGSRQGYKLPGKWKAALRRIISGEVRVRGVA